MVDRRPPGPCAVLLFLVGAVPHALLACNAVSGVNDLVVIESIGGAVSGGGMVGGGGSAGAGVGGNAGSTAGAGGEAVFPKPDGGVCPVDQCGDLCVDTSSDENHCGECDNACPERTNATALCSGSECGFSCHEGFDDCDGMAGNGCEADLSSDPDHCSRCDSPCADACFEGECVDGQPCGSSLCAPPTGVCCWSGATGSCESSAPCSAGAQIDCGGPVDCPGELCCATIDLASRDFERLACAGTCSGPDKVIVCDPNAASQCAGMRACLPEADLPSGYHTCR